jgi:hypothetical protein
MVRRIDLVMMTLKFNWRNIDYTTYLDKHLRCMFFVSQMTVGVPLQGL